jgi:hypothetical protein
MLALDAERLEHAADQAVVTDRHHELDELAIVQVGAHAREEGVVGVHAVDQRGGERDHIARGLIEDLEAGARPQRGELRVRDADVLGDPGVLARLRARIEKP